MDCKTEARQATTTLSRGAPATRVPREAEWEFAGFPGRLRNSHKISYNILATIKGTQIFCKFKKKLKKCLT